MAKKQKTSQNDDQKDEGSVERMAGVLLDYVKQSQALHKEFKKTLKKEGMAVLNEAEVNDAAADVSKAEQLLDE